MQSDIKTAHEQEVEDFNSLNKELVASKDAKIEKLKGKVH
jgi:hypothetical protein